VADASIVYKLSEELKEDKLSVKIIPREELEGDGEEFVVELLAAHDIKEVVSLTVEHALLEEVRVVLYMG
jgi:hypothetical protein